MHLRKQYIEVVLKYTREMQTRVLPEPVSMMLDCPRRSATSRDEPGMLTGSERTGWILHTFSI